MNHTQLSSVIIPVAAAHDYFIQAMVMTGVDRDEWINKGLARLLVAVENAVGYTEKAA